MPKPDTRRVAEHLLQATPERIYQQILPETKPPTPRPRIDTLGAGDFEIVGFHPPGSEPLPSFKKRGLFLRTRRPAGLPAFNRNGEGITSTIAGVRVHPPSTPGQRLPDEFVVTATFRAPKQGLFTPSEDHPIGADDHPGEWAPVIVAFTTDPELAFFAASAQFREATPTRPEGMRLNAPGTGTPAGLANIDPAFFLAIMREPDPVTFTLVVHVDRSSDPSKFRANMFVEAQPAYPLLADPPVSIELDEVLEPGKIIEHIGAGIATGGGARFNVSVEIHEFEIWAKQP